MKRIYMRTEGYDSFKDIVDHLLKSEGILDPKDKSVETGRNTVEMAIKYAS